jgi:hypothetical protein
MKAIELYEQKKVRTFDTDPQYFGAFLNMARHNIYSISNHVSKKLGKDNSFLSDEEKIKASFLCLIGNKKIDWRLTYAIIKKFLPIVTILDNELFPSDNLAVNEGTNYERLPEILKPLFDDIHDFRNDYSHYFHKTEGTNRKISISSELAIFLRDSFQKAIELTKYRFKSNSPESKDIFEESDFDLCNNLILVDSDNKITQFGLVFLICIFLEREYAFLFIGKIKGLKGTHFKNFLAIREVFMAFCVKLPHDRLLSSDYKQSFTLDLINELNKCPKELYNVIPEKTKKLFLPELSLISQNNLLENSTNQEKEIVENFDNYIESLTKRIRHENRFPFFALKYIDELNIFEKWKFHLNLGKLTLRKYTKKINNEEFDRLIVENVKAFGKLKDYIFDEEIIEDKKNEILKKIDPENCFVDFEQFAPHYNIKNNKIGILAKGMPISKLINNNLIQPQPDAFLSIHELPKIILLEYLKKGKTEEIIDDFITKNNQKIFNKSFIEEVKAKLPQDWNDFEKRTDSRKYNAYSPGKLEYLAKRKTELNKVLLEYGLNDKQIPSRILDYWLVIKDVSLETKLSDYIKLMKLDCKDRLKALQHKEKSGKGRIPKIGEMATYLAKDIVTLIISREKKNKITSFYYDKIQECFALYADPAKRELLHTILFNELKLNEPDGHPFISKIKFNEIKYTYDLYKQYITEKGCKESKKLNRNNKEIKVDESWLRTAFYSSVYDKETKKYITVVKFPDNIANLPYSFRTLIEKENYSLDNWLSHITNGKTEKDKKKPIDLPVNLFDETLSQLLKADLEKNSINYPKENNFNELFKLWWNKLRNDDVQSFYNSDREYLIYDEKITFTPNTRNKYSEYYKEISDRIFKMRKRQNPKLEIKQQEKVFKNTIGGTEKIIRIMQEEDRLILLMLDKLLENDENEIIKLKEADVLLNKQIKITQIVPGKLLFDSNGQIIRNGNHQEISKTITANRKRKDYSVLRKFCYDRRLPELFEYYNENEIPLELLKNELDTYNKMKEIILDYAFNLEAKIISKDKAGILNLFNKSGNVQHEPYLNWLLTKGYINQGEYIFLNMVRNSFSHNQFPQKQTINRFVNTIEQTNFAALIADKYIEKIEHLLTEIDKI